MRPMCETAKQVLKKADFTAYSGLSARVPPDHTRIRKVVSGVFTPRRYRVLAPLVRDTVSAMLDAMLAKPKGDLVADLAYDLPALTILTLLGVAAEKVAEVKRWAKSRVLLTWGNLCDAEQAAHAENLVAYWNYCQALVAARHAELLDDLPGDLVALQRDGAEITDHEIASFCYSLLTAGHETTTNLIANGLLSLAPAPRGVDRSCGRQGKNSRRDRGDPALRAIRRCLATQGQGCYQHRRRANPGRGRPAAAAGFGEPR